MAVLNASDLSRIQMENERPVQVHGRPVAMIRDLLDTIQHMKKEKNKWQAIAEKRGKGLGDIYSIVVATAAKTRGIDENVQA